MGVSIEISTKHYNTDKLRDGIVRVGWFEGVRYKDGTPVARVARAHEYGYGVPRRSFLRPVIFRNEKNWVAQLGAVYARAVANNEDTLPILDRFGRTVKAAIQHQIWEGHYLPLKPSTIKAKGGRTKPLIDTTLMVNSIDVQVEENK